MKTVAIVSNFAMASLACAIVACAPAQPPREPEPELEPAARPMTEEEREQMMREQREAEERAMRVPDCPMHVPMVQLTAMPEPGGASLAFTLPAEADEASIQNLRSSVRILAEQYQERLPMLLASPTPVEPGLEEGHEGRMQRPGQEPEPGPGPMEERPGEPTRPEAPTMDPQASPVTIGVEDVERGARITLRSQDEAQVELLRSQIGEDAQLMAETRECPPVAPPGRGTLE